MGLKRGNLRIERVDLEGDLVITDGGYLLPGLDLVSFGDRKLDDYAADAGTRSNRVTRLDAAIETAFHSTICCGSTLMVSANAGPETAMNAARRTRRMGQTFVRSSEGAARLEAEFAQYGGGGAKACKSGLQQVDADEGGGPDK